jgi:transmembrane sensor
MSELRRLPNAKQAEREASEWIARLNADDVSAGDRARFEAWRACHACNARAYEALAATWRELEAAGPLVRAVSFAQSINEATRPRATRRRWVYAMAATVAAVAIAGWWYGARLAAGATFTTAIGEHATVSLPDDSILELNSDSLARVDYSKHSRVIRLERGEGFFKVAHDSGRPFWVLAGGSWVRAVGTAFNVYLRPSGVEVTVSEGAVKIGSAESFASSMPSDDATARTPISLLTSGQQADLRTGAMAARQLSTAELQRAVAWREGTVYFENQPLADVVEELQRYTPLQIIVQDEKLRRLSVGGTFRANPQGADALLNMLEQGFGLRLRRQGDRVYVEGEQDSSPN